MSGHQASRAKRDERGAPLRHTETEDKEPNSMSGHWRVRLDDGSLISPVLLAGNFWLFASSAAQLSALTSAWLDVLSEHGWKVPLSEATWCTSGPDENTLWRVQARDECIRRASRAVGFAVLGVQVPFDNCFEAELRYRMSRAWRAFYEHAHLLRYRTAPWQDPLRLLHTLVSTSLVWCCASWDLASRQCSKLRGLH